MKGRLNFFFWWRSWYQKQKQRFFPFHFFSCHCFCFCFCFPTQTTIAKFLLAFSLPRSIEMNRYLCWTGTILIIPNTATLSSDNIDNIDLCHQAQSKTKSNLTDDCMDNNLVELKFWATYQMSRLSEVKLTAEPVKITGHELPSNYTTN